MNLVHLAVWVLFSISESSPIRQPEMLTSELSHVVVIPDVHGDAPALLRSLWLAVVKVDNNPDLSYADFSRTFRAATKKNRRRPRPPLSTTRSVGLVQLGDLVDRGPYSLRCISIMEVAESVLGWRVITLVGNHEIISTLGTNHLFVHPTEVLRAGGSITARNAMFDIGQPLHARMASGMVAMARLSTGAFGGSVPYHHNRSPATLFVHGGINMGWMKRLALDGDIESVNAAFQTALSRVSTLSLWNNPNSPLWTRDFVDLSESDLCGSVLTRVLDNFKVARIIVGHTPQDDWVVKSRCQGRIILTDVRMSRWMNAYNGNGRTMEGGNPVAVIMGMDAEGFLESIVAHYTDLKTGTDDRETVIFPGPGHDMQTREEEETEEHKKQASGPMRWMMAYGAVATAAALITYGLIRS